MDCQSNHVFLSPTKYKLQAFVCIFAQFSTMLLFDSILPMSILDDVIFKIDVDINTNVMWLMWILRRLHLKKVGWSRDAELG